MLGRIDGRRRGLGRADVPADGRGVVDRGEDVRRGVAERRGRLVAEVARQVAPDVGPAFVRVTLHPSSSSVLVHRPQPVQVGERFSMKARIPSRWSSVAKSSKKAARSARRPAVSDRSAAASTERLAARTASGGIAAIVSASSSAASTVSAAGTTFVTSPAAFASAAGIARPVRISSMASADPTARVRRCVPPAPGITPIRISGWPNWASSPATMRSHVMASSQPPPSAKPRTAAISGSPMAPMRSHAVKWPSACSRSGLWSASSTMSAPAANARSPAPVRTMTRIRSSRSSASSWLGQLFQEREAERVARLGSIDGHERDAVMALDRGIDTDQAGGRLDVGHADSLRVRGLRCRSSIHVPGSVARPLAMHADRLTHPGRPRPPARARSPDRARSRADSDPPPASRPSSAPRPTPPGRRSPSP